MRLTRLFALYAAAQLVFSLLLILFLGLSSVSAENIYIAQIAYGSNTGTDSANAHAMAWFNNSTNWGSGADKIGPGDTVRSMLNLSVNAMSGNTISFYVTTSRGGHYSLEVYNVKRHSIWRYQANQTEAGKHLVKWRLPTAGSNRQASGVYFGVLKTGGKQISKSVVKVR